VNSMATKGLGRAPRNSAWRLAIVLLAANVSGEASPASSNTTAPAPLTLGPGARYVSMGSSFAAGPGVSNPADTSADRCRRSIDNYAHQFARRRQLALVDVACSGATTAHVLGRWNELAPQIAAVTPDTALVTVTVGGNDVGLVRSLMAYSCAAQPMPPLETPGGTCPSPALPHESDWRALEASLDGIASAVRSRAPGARLVFVQYTQMLPARGSCPVIPIRPADVAVLKGVQHRLALVTARVAWRWHAAIVDPRETGVPHDPCAAIPWANGFPVTGGPAFFPFHPNLAGMTAIAARLDRIVH